MPILVRIDRAGSIAIAMASSDWFVFKAAKELECSELLSTEKGRKRYGQLAREVVEVCVRVSEASTDPH